MDSVLVAIVGGVSGGIIGAVVSGIFSFWLGRRTSKDATYHRHADLLEEADVALRHYRDQRPDSRSTAMALEAGRADVADRLRPKLRMFVGREFEDEFTGVLDHLYAGHVSKLLGVQSSPTGQEPSDLELVERFQMTAANKYATAATAHDKFVNRCSDYLQGKNPVGPRLERRRTRRANRNTPGGDPSAAPDPQL